MSPLEGNQQKVQGRPLSVDAHKQV